MSLRQAWQKGIIEKRRTRSGPEKPPLIVRAFGVLVASVAAQSLGSCVATGSSSQTGGTADASTPSTSTSPQATGIACTTDTNTQVTLCAATSACPAVTVDATSFPSCGFRTLLPTFELDCICYGNYVCPIGTVANCADITTLLSKKTPTDVCNEVSLGLCTQGTNSPSTGTGGRSSTCDQACYQSCVGAPACIVACGC